MKKDSVVKIIITSIAAILVLWIVKSILFPTVYGVNIQGNHMREHMYSTQYYSYGFEGTIAVLLTFLIKILFMFLILGLVVGLAIYVKNNVFTQTDIIAIKDRLTINKQELKTVCHQCGKEIKADWKVCPYCGKEVN